MKERQPRRLNSEALWAYALKSLGGRAHSIGELREKLRRRAERSGDIDDILARLKEHGYLDDKRFAEGFASARLSNRGLGSTRVIQDLRQRRVSPTLAEKTVQELYRDVDEAALIEDWVRRKYRTAVREGLFQDDKDMAAACRRLLRAGFRMGAIREVLKRFAKNPDLLDAWEPPEESDRE
jgi:regulatory protein